MGDITKQIVSGSIELSISVDSAELAAWKTDRRDRFFVALAEIQDTIAPAATVPVKPGSKRSRKPRRPPTERRTGNPLIGAQKPAELAVAADVVTAAPDGEE